MPNRIQNRVCLLVFSCLFLLGGCVKLTQSVTLMPDGSGKIDLEFGLSRQLIDLANENEEDPFNEVRPEVMQHKTRGIVAMTDPRKQNRKDGFTYLSYSMYFRDINEVRIEGLGEGKPAKYRYTRNGDAATLTVQHGTVLSLIAEYKPTPENERADVRKALDGLSFSEHFTLPGDIKKIDGLLTRDNTAQLKLSLDHLLEGTGPVERLQNQNQLRFPIEKLSIEDQAVEAFNKELAEAVAAWQERLKDAE